MSKLGPWAHRPWLVTIPTTTILPCQYVTIALASPRATPSLRKLTLHPAVAGLLTVRSFKLGDIETGRELLGTGPAPGFLFMPDQPELFDVPVEAGQGLVLVVENMSDALDAWVSGALLGMGPLRRDDASAG